MYYIHDLKLSEILLLLFKVSVLFFSICILLGRSDIPCRGVFLRLFELDLEGGCLTRLVGMLSRRSRARKEKLTITKDQLLKNIVFLGAF